MIDIQNINNDTPLTELEGYELTKFYVNYFWRTNKFYSLKDEYEEEDVVQILTLKFYNHNLYSKYNKNITSKKYHIMNAVRTSMIDLLRKHRETYSLDAENKDGYVYVELLDSGKDMVSESEGMEIRNRIIDNLPETSKSSVKGYSPLFNSEINLSYKVLALHLEAGYRIKDIAQLYKNPQTNQPISVGTISAYIRDMREYILDNIVIA